MQERSAGDHWMLKLVAGEDLFPTLSEFARRNQVRAASIDMGIGMFESATVAYWNGQEYDPSELSEPHEVVALHGSIADEDGAPSLHMHAGLANRRHELVGGHLLRAKVGILLELSVHQLPGARFSRPFDESVGLRMLDLCPPGEPTAPR